MRLNWVSPLIAGFSVFFAHPSVGLAQIDALLPYKDAIEAGPLMPIDGVYKISTTGTRIRIEGGRGYALDEWIQLFFRIRPNMVTMQNIKRVKAGSYKGYDLPLLSNAALELGGDGTLKVDVKTMTGPASFVLTPLSVDDPNGFNTERVAAGFKGPRLNIPPTARRREMALGDASHSGHNNPVNVHKSARGQSQQTARELQTGRKSPVMFKTADNMRQKQQGPDAAAGCLKIVGKDPDTGLDICDYPIPELN